MSRKRSSFTPEFKDEMVKLYLDQRARRSLTQVARENGVGAETLPNWVKAYEKAHPVEEVHPPRLGIAAVRADRRAPSADPPIGPGRLRRLAHPEQALSVTAQPLER